MRVRYGVTRGGSENGQLSYCYPVGPGLVDCVEGKVVGCVSLQNHPYFVILRKNGDFVSVSIYSCVVVDR